MQSRNGCSSSSNVCKGNIFVGLCRLKVSAGLDRGWLATWGPGDPGLCKLRSTVSLVCKRTAITSTCITGARLSWFLSRKCTLSLHRAALWNYNKADIWGYKCSVFSCLSYNNVIIIMIIITSTITFSFQYQRCSLSFRPINCWLDTTNF